VRNTTVQSSNASTSTAGTATSQAKTPIRALW
jgi:hypothetical protein